MNKKPEIWWSIIKPKEKIKHPDKIKVFKISIKTFPMPLFLHIN